MKRRPHIPLKVRCIVALRQIGYSDGKVIDDLISKNRPNYVHPGAGGFANFLKRLLDEIRIKLGEEVLRLDHNPALGLREYSPRTGRWTPDANDPEFLIYRGFHGHNVKTYVRGDHGQFNDTTLMKRERRRKRKSIKGQLKTPIKSRKFRWPKGRRLQSRPFQRTVKRRPL